MVDRSTSNPVGTMLLMIAGLGTGEGVAAFTIDPGEVSVPHLSAACVLFFLFSGGVAYMRGRPRTEYGEFS